MPTPTKGPRLGGSPAHERLMLANLATALFEHGKITTTETKAKRLRPLAEQLITKAKRGDLHARRQVLTVVRTRTSCYTLFDRDRAAVRQPPGWLHPDHQDRPAQGRQRADGDHRAGRGASGRRADGEQEDRRPQGRAAGQGRGARPGADKDEAYTCSPRSRRGTPTARRHTRSDKTGPQGRRAPRRSSSWSRSCRSPRRPGDEGRRAQGAHRRSRRSPMTEDAAGPKATRTPRRR